ncbi:hypothetical protein CPT_Pollock50 [Escherichia phage Pollock]|uniref:PD-(D/E)XK endonuclease-like domain-containing protein n=1 Tax=Escherichia phage Pollock TaxID=1540097 RepID=A0A0A0YPX0_9CAUD|nr:exonuclease [Escherichia phage Pollock]AIX12409.1 hypothetical protein CPT_Pollock50 [Escherichia phage Pollock]
MKLTNNTNIALSMAVWLAQDDYDYIEKPNYISATSLLKSVRQLVLMKRLTSVSNASTDVADRISNRMGSAFHDAIERAWKGNYQQSLNALGYPKRVIESIRINPTPEELNEDVIPIWLEQRVEKEFKGWIIGGKFDMVMEYRLRDVKSTSVFTYMNKSNDEKFRIQGSIYRWLNPEKIKHDYMYIDYLFTDWSANQAKSNKDYPQQKILEYPLQLKSVHETEQYIASKLAALEKYKDSPEPELPECTEEELWRAKPVYKYYKNPNSTGRSTKNFDNLHDANLRLAQDGGVGIVVTVPGEVKACKHCPVYSLCTQKDRYLASGELVISD